MILAAAQTKPHRGDIAANLDDHHRWIKMAAGQGAALIVFPELSITGYERENAAHLAFSANDTRLDEMKSLAVQHKMVIIAGAPIKIDHGLFIGSFIIQSDGSVAVYTKQFLHPGEEVAYQPSFDYNPVVKLDTERISFAICADIDHSEHPANAGKIQSTIYIPSIFFSPHGIPEAHRLLSNYAQKQSMDVLMSNYGGPSWGYDAGGQSAFWNKNGALIAELGVADEGLLIVERKDSSWTGKKLVIEAQVVHPGNIL